MVSDVNNLHPYNTVFLLLFTALVTPYELGFVPDTKLDGLFMVNQYVNLCFIFDIALNFYLPTAGRCKLDPSLKESRFQSLIVERMTVLSN